MWCTYCFVLKVPVTQKDHLWKDLCRGRAQRHWKEQKGVAFGAVICLDGRKSRKVGHWASRSVKHRWHHSYTTNALLLIKQLLCAAANSSTLVPAHWWHWLLFMSFTFYSVVIITRLSFFFLSPVGSLRACRFGRRQPLLLFPIQRLWMSPTRRIYKRVKSPFSEKLCHKNHMQ